MSVGGFLISLQPSSLDVLSQFTVLLLLGMWWWFLVLEFWTFEAQICYVAQASLKPTKWPILALSYCSVCPYLLTVEAFKCMPMSGYVCPFPTSSHCKILIQPTCFPVIPFLNVVKCTIPRCLAIFLTCAQDSCQNNCLVSYFVANFILILGSCVDFFIFTSPAVSCMLVWIWTLPSPSSSQLSVVSLQSFFLSLKR